MGIKNLVQKLILGLILGLVVILALGLAADLPRLLESLRRWQWNYLPLMFLAVLANYGLRFLRWHYYLGVIGVRGTRSNDLSRSMPLEATKAATTATAASLGWYDSLLVFLSGFALTMTPGKLGEVAKSFLLKQLNDTPVSYSASLVIAERLTDVLGMVLLAALGLGAFQFGGPALAIVLAGSLILILLVQQRNLMLRLLDRLGRFPLVGRFGGLGRNLYESSYLLLKWRPLSIAVLLAALAWFGECLAFFLVILGLGITPTLGLLLQATFIYALASLLGAISFLPGGLGATEGSMALLLTQLSGLGKDQAIAATLLVRFATLWFAVLLGLAALFVFQKRLGTYSESS